MLFKKISFDPVQWAATTFNALLSRQPAAQALLAQHAGRTFHLCASGLVVALTINHDGRLTAADQRIVPDVTLRIDLSRLLRSGWTPGKEWPDAAGLTHVTGDVAMAQTLSTLAEHWRPELEDLLSEYVGDVAALQLVQATKSVVKGALDVGSKISQNLVEYLAYETRELTPTPVMETLKIRYFEHEQQLSELDRRLDTLSQRLKALEGRQRQRVSRGDQE